MKEEKNHNIMHQFTGFVLSSLIQLEISKQVKSIPWSRSWWRINNWFSMRGVRSLILILVMRSHPSSVFHSSEKFIWSDGRQDYNMRVKKSHSECTKRILAAFSVARCIAWLSDIRPIFMRTSWNTERTFHSTLFSSSKLVTPLISQRCTAPSFCVYGVIWPLAILSVISGTVNLSGLAMISSICACKATFISIQ